MRRRQTLLGTTGLLFGAAGCSTRTRSQMVDIVLFNQTDTPYTVELAVFESGDSAPRSEARVFDATIAVDPQGTARRDAVAEARQYLVRYELYEDNSRLRDEDHVHYYPTDTDGDDELSFDVQSAGKLTRR